jgi:hypothetical protein
VEEGVMGIEKAVRMSKVETGEKERQKREGCGKRPIQGGKSRNLNSVYKRCSLNLY